MRIHDYLWAEGERKDVWAILDGARDRRVFPLLLDSYLEHSCLYAGDLAPELELAAPYLVRLECEDRYSQRLLELAWGNSWGVFLRCDAGMPVLRRHLRSLLVVRGPSGRRLVFRYYDPRVLRVFLPTCFPAELAAVFGPIRRFFIEAGDPGQAHEFTFKGDRLGSHLLHLGDETSQSSIKQLGTGG